MTAPDLLLQLALFAGALLANLLSALAGGGAGLVQLPLLILLGLPFPLALATHKLASVALGVGATLRHARERSLNLRFALLILISGLAVSRCREEAPLTGRRVIRGLAWVLTRPEWLLRHAGLLRKSGRRADVAADVTFEESRVLPATGVIAWREMSLSILARRSGQMLVSVLPAALIRRDRPGAGARADLRIAGAQRGG